MKELIIVGVNGTLGKGAAKALIRKKYDKVYLCDRKPIEWLDEAETSGGEPQL